MTIKLQSFRASKRYLNHENLTHDRKKQQFKNSLNRIKNHTIVTQMCHFCHLPLIFFHYVSVDTCKERKDASFVFKVSFVVCFFYFDDMEP